MALDNRERCNQAFRTLYEQLCDDHAEQFVTLMLEAGVLWLCEECNWENGDGECCDNCGKAQPCEGEEAPS